MGEIKKSELDKISKIMGVDTPNKTVIKIKDTDDRNKKTIELVEGSWEDKHPWFVIDDSSGEHYAIMPARSIAGIFAKYKGSSEENFKLNLEKAILQNMPIDFEDVWVVALKEIQRLVEDEGEQITNKDMLEVVRSIKKKYPNLFLNINDMIAAKQGGF